MFHSITKTDHNQNGPLLKRTTLKRTITKMDYQKKICIARIFIYFIFLLCVYWCFFLTCLICDNYFLDLWINQISTGNLVKPSNYWCFNWFMTPKSLLIRLNNLIIRWLCKCVLSWIYFSGAICTVVCPHCENDNEWKQTPCSFIVYEPKIKEIYSFL